MNWRVVFLLMSLIAYSTANAELVASVDDDDIDEMQTIQLTLRQTGSDQAKEIDLDALQQDFEVQNTNTQSQFRSINGQVSSWVEYRIALRPKRAGRLRIPPLTLGTEVSEPIDIRVRAVSEAVRKQINELVYFDVTLDRETVYVQAQAVLTRRLYYTAGVQIYGDLPGAPALDNAVVLTLGEATSGYVRQNGRRYGVLEQRYAIFPERSGSLEIPGFAVTSSVSLADRGRRGVRVQAPTKTLTVLPVPASYPAELPWLPAEDVIVDERWEPSTTNLAAGDAVKRTIEVTATGNVGSAIPPFEAPISDAHFKQYPQPVNITDDPRSPSVIGRRTQAYELIAAFGGTTRSSPLVIHWWDTNADELRRAELSATTFVISGEPPPADAVTANEPNPTPATTDTPQAEQTAEPPWGTWIISALIGIAIAVAVWALMTRLPSLPVIHLRRRELKRASRGQSRSGYKHALVSYAAALWGVSKTQALEKICESIEGGAALINALNSDFQRYDHEDDALPANRLEVEAAIRQSAQPGRPQAVLPPLYAN